MTPIDAARFVLRRIAGATKGLDTRRQFVASTQRAGEAQRRFRLGDSEAEAMIAAVSSWAWIAASKRGTAIASHPVRVFREVEATVTDRRRSKRARVLSPTERRRMADPMIVGTKAALLMDGRSEVEEVHDHPACYLMRRPNIEEPGFQARERMHTMLPIVGNAYSLISFENDVPDLSERYQSSEGAPVALYSMFPQHTMPIPDPDEIRVPRGYLYARDRADSREFDADRVVHHMHRASPVDPFRGEGELWSVLPEHQTLRGRLDANAALARQNFRPDWIMSIPGLTEEQRLNVQDALAARFAGPHTAGVFMVMNAESSVTPLAFPQKPEAMHALDEYYRQAVLAAMGVPEALIQMNDASLGADNTTPAMVQFAQLTIRPALRAEIDNLNAQLAHYWDDSEGGPIFFACDDPVPENVSAEVDKYTRILTVGGASVNEMRAALGLDPRREPEADALLFNGQPLGVAQQLGGLLGGLYPAPVADDSEPEKVDVPVAKVEEQALNGAQIQQLLTIAERVSLGDLPREAGRSIAYAAFPGVPAEKVDAIFDKLIEGSASEGDGNGARGPDDSLGTDGRSLDRDAGGSGVHGPGGDGVDPVGKRDTAHRCSCGCDPVRATVPDPADRGDDLRKRARGDGDGEGDGGDPARPAEQLISWPADDYWSVGWGTKAADSDVLTQEEQDALKPLEDDLRGFFERRLPEGIREGADLSRYRDELNEIIANRLSAAFMLGADLGIDELVNIGFPNAEDAGLLPESEGAAWVRQQGTIISQTALDTAGQQIGQALERLAEQGLSDPEAREEVARAFAEVAPARAETIARTETQNAVQAGRLRGWQEAGVEKKRWQLAGGACPVCEGIARKYGNKSQAIPVDQPFYTVGDTITGSDGKAFAVGFRNIDAPPAHPNCRCTAVPIYGEDA